MVVEYSTLWINYKMKEFIANKNKKKCLPMKRNILFSIAASYMTLVGLGLIFAPKALGVGAVPTDASAALIAFLRLWGSILLGIAVLNWMARYEEPSTALNAIILVNIVGFLLSLPWTCGARSVAGARQPRCLL